MLVLYTGNACPWCHRVLLALTLLKRTEGNGIEGGLSSGVQTVELDDDPANARKGGWVIAGGSDPVFGESDLFGVYTQGAAPETFNGKCTAPLLVYQAAYGARRRGILLSNESDEIVKLLDEAARACRTISPSITTLTSSESAISIGGGMYLSLKSPKSPEHMALKKMIYEKI